MEFYTPGFDLEGCFLWDVNEYGFLELEVYDDLEE
jgi:hypothetical protein